MSKKNEKTREQKIELIKEYFLNVLACYIKQGMGLSFRNGLPTITGINKDELDTSFDSLGATAGLMNPLNTKEFEDFCVDSYDNKWVTEEDMEEENKVYENEFKDDDE